MIKGKNLGILSLDTGELIAAYNEDIRVQTEDEIQSRKNYFNGNQNKGIPQESSSSVNDQPKSGRMNTLYEKRGSFIWNIHTTAQTLFPEIKASGLTRLMYLATFLGYDGYLVDIDKKPLSKTDIKHYLSIQDRDFYQFIHSMSQANLLFEKENKFYLNEGMFARGSFSKDRIKDLVENEQYITRIYIAGVRSLYHSATIPSHTTLSYIFRILPYVNREYNVCCFNPLETEKSKIQLMSLGDFADVVGYDRAHISRLGKILFEPIFDVNGKLRNAIRYVSTSGFSKESMSMFINPCVYYAGSHWKDVEILGCF